ncbi:helix-turn-helix domain-containing protein [Variovorax sp. YR752]|uniref:helix-turn-helix domain-containing protein n=1 Tax=Variovorax sp. YR752 TaxID=1884383 RepID=UPI00313782CD
MADAFPVCFPNQLRQHLRALRKRHGLTQAQLGALIGVSQARIAEIEANPGLVNFEQLMKLLSVLGVSLTLQEGTAAPAATSVTAARTSKPRATKPQPKAVSRQPEVPPASRRSFVARPKKGSW